MSTLTSDHQDMVRRTIDPTAIQATFTPDGSSSPLDAHDERRRLLKAGLWVEARPRALTATTAAELGACIATLIISAGRPDILPGIGNHAPDLSSIAASLKAVVEMDDANMIQWWSDLVDATEENMIGEPSVEAMSRSTVMGMRSVVGTLASRVAAATEQVHAT